MTVLEWVRLIIGVYVGVGAFVFGLALTGARTARERRYALQCGLFWPKLFGRRPL